MSYIALVFVSFFTFSSFAMTCRSQDGATVEVSISQQGEHSIIKLSGETYNNTFIDLTDEALHSRELYTEHLCVMLEGDGDTPMDIDYDYPPETPVCSAEQHFYFILDMMLSLMEMYELKEAGHQFRVGPTLFAYSIRNLFGSEEFSRQMYEEEEPSENGSRPDLLVYSSTLDKFSIIFNTDETIHFVDCK